MTRHRIAVILNACMVAILCGLPQTAYGAAPMQVYRFPLAKFMTADEPIELRRSTDQYTVFVPLSRRLQVRSAVLHLQFRNSISLLEHRSQLQVSLNEQVIAQAPLKPQQPEATLDIRLPASLLQADYNRLQFRVTQHYTLECEDPAAPELWTQIDPLASTLSVEAAFAPLAPTLSDFANLLDRKLWGEQRVHILTGASPPRDVHLRWGALVAQGAALRLDYVPVQVTHGAAVRRTPGVSEHAEPRLPYLDQHALAGTDTILIGTTAELSPYLSEALLERIDGSYLAVYPLDTDPGHFLLLISGRNEEEVSQAATAFAFPGFPFSETVAMRIGATPLPILPPYTAALTVHENVTYSLSRFGFASTTVAGMDARSLRFELALPPDLFAHEDSTVELGLHVAYGAGLRQDSAVNLLLNDTFEAALPLNQESGAAYRGYKIPIPLRSFRPGRNTVTFAPHLLPLVTGKCIAQPEDNLVLTIFEDSTLTVPPASHYVRLPDLQLFAKMAFPYAVHPDGSFMAVHVAGQDSQTIAAAWMLIAKLAQKVGTPLHATEFSFSPPTQNKQLIAVGASDQLHTLIHAAAPTSFSSPTAILAPSLLVSLPHEDAPTPWTHMLTSAKRFFPGAALAVPAPPSVFPLAANMLEESTAALMFESSLHPGKTTVAIVASGASQLFQGVSQLIQPELWENLRGAAVVWRDPPSSLRWQPASRSYYMGDVSVSTRLEYHFSQSPWLWVITVLMAIGLFAVLTHVLLQRFQRRRHGEVSTVPSA